MASPGIFVLCLACPKNGKSGPHCWGRGGWTQFTQRLESAVIVPPLVGCVVWSFFGGDDLAGATVFFTSATQVVVPTDRETDGTDLLLTAGRCFLVTG